MNIDGFSEKTAGLLFDEFGVQNYSDLFKLDKDAVRELEGYKDAKTENLFNAIEKSKTVELSAFIYALGIDNVGKKTAKDLAKVYKSIENFINCDRESLLSIEEVGEVIADCIVNFVTDIKNVNEINELISLGVNILPELDNKTGVFSGEKVVLTGTLVDFKRDDATKIIEKLGGEILSSVSKKTTIVLAGENAGSKLDKARALGIKIIDEETFKSLIKTW